MKKFLAIAAAIIMMGCVFTACSSSNDKTTTTKAAETTVENPTDDAKIKDSDAVSFIKDSYTEKELGLDKVKDEYSFMIASTGEKIDGELYVKVAANVKTENDETSEGGKTTYTLKSVGEYYISYDGEKVLMKDSDTGEYKELENRYQDYSAKKEKENKSETEKSTTKKASKTTNKK